VQGWRRGRDPETELDVAISDIGLQAAGGLGVFGVLLYMARNAFASDRPLRHAVTEIQKRLDAERTRNDALETENSQLRTDRDTARSELSAARSELAWAKREQALLEKENRRLRGDPA
jgi:uncharacterized protein (DUF3084 family)